MFVTVTACVHTDSSGVATEIPVLLTPAGPLVPLIDYLLARSHDRSIKWMRLQCQAVALFLEYLGANPNEHQTVILFQHFAQRLYTGTFDRHTGLDPSHLCWHPKPVRLARTIIHALSEFFEWLGQIRPIADTLNPRYAGGAYDRLYDEVAYQARRHRAFLGHTWAPHSSSDRHGFLIRPQREPVVSEREPPAFPEDRFIDFLQQGFRVAAREDLRAMLITLLMHGAGFRESEPFHLYIQDVCPDPTDPTQALVRIHHPSQGIAPRDPLWRQAEGSLRTGTRSAYLSERYALLPRNQMTTNQAAGWKGGMHDGRYFKEAHWFPPLYGVLFLTLWKRYLHQLPLDRRHPFAFVNLYHEPCGAMLTINNYRKIHAAACARIGLQVGKALGTTPHGHRHAYGRRLQHAGVDPILIRRCMHHSSPESQVVYTQPNTREVRTSLMQAAQRLDSSQTMAKQFLSPQSETVSTFLTNPEET